MKKKPSTIKDILFLAISSFIVVVAWIGFNLYHTYVTSTITPELQTSITPITADFDTATINKLKTRNQVAPVNALSNTIITPTPINTTAVAPVIIATSSGSTTSIIPNEPQAQPTSAFDLPTIPGE